jgi:hypothetical protein
VGKINSRNSISILITAHEVGATELKKVSKRCALGHLMWHSLPLIW